MTQRIQGGAGSSLALQWQTRGGRVELKSLEDGFVSLVEEMGGVQFSERLGCDLLRAPAGALTQSVDFETRIDAGTTPPFPIPRTAFKVNQIYVFTDTAARLDRVAIMARSIATGFEIPIFVWNAASDIEVAVLFSDEAAAAAVVRMCVPTEAAQVRLPHFQMGDAQPSSVPVLDALIMRGSTLAFGAGTVSPVVIMQLSSTDFRSTPQATSRGLPLPSW